ncbi:hypothetical protein [Caulobacter endophyticus]|uniref:hypothetical protein n=1 Tax=Caulobacter endophyticus TaxID=2172652 RepID=UPI00240F73A7|nr:hypothetical protein [Caulobacter endophyticus]MDG2528921.1 hypothetical protein [Caulobacter endophyticus]
MNGAFKSLLADALNSQVELAEPAALEALAPRLRDYARGAPWRDEDVRMVWSSPAARRLYLRERRLVLDEVEAGWADRGLARDFVRRAADSGDADALSLQESGVSIRIMRAPGSGDWLINVVLSAEAAALVPAGTKVQIADSGGLEWLTGELDRAGGVDAFWTNDAQSPIERLQEHSLRLTFV